jgi:hypothetical protein
VDPQAILLTVTLGSAHLNLRQQQGTTGTKEILLVLQSKTPPDRVAPNPSRSPKNRK